MRAIHAILFGVTGILASAADAEPRRQAIPIGGEWNLSGNRLERAKMDGKRVVQMIAKGDARLKKGRNQFIGPWTLEATAAVIECDFTAKRFLLRGPFEIQQKVKNGESSVIQGTAAESTAELPFQGEGIRINGPSKTRLLDPAAITSPPDRNGDKAPMKK